MKLDMSYISHADQARPLWDRLLEIGKGAGLKPAGLASRDLLRLDMGYFLYGNDLTEETTPVEAGAEWVVAFQKENFIGASVIKKQKEEGPARRLSRIRIAGKGRASSWNENVSREPANWRCHQWKSFARSPKRNRARIY